MNGQGKNIFLASLKEKPCGQSIKTFRADKRFLSAVIKRCGDHVKDKPAVIPAYIDVIDFSLNE